MRESNPRRDKIEIVADILEKARRGAKKTNIMYGCNLSFTQTEEYLQALSGLLELAPDGQYRATPEGINASKIAEEAIRTFSEVYKKLREK